MYPLLNSTEQEPSSSDGGARIAGGGEVGRAGKWDELQQWGGGLPQRQQNKRDNWPGHPTVRVRGEEKRNDGSDGAVS